MWCNKYTALTMLIYITKSKLNFTYSCPKRTNSMKHISTQAVRISLAGSGGVRHVEAFIKNG